MKRILILLVLTAVCMPSQAKNDYRKVKMFEVEIGAGGLCSSTLNVVDGKAKTSHELFPSFFIEQRINIAHGPFDEAINLNRVVMKKVVNNVMYDSRLWGLTVFGDYNFCRGRKITPFAGLGFGMATANVNCSMPTGKALELGVVSQEDIADSFPDLVDTGALHNNTAVMVPRIGVEFINRIRLTAEYRVMKKQYSYFGMNLGVVFGGGYIKKRR